MLALSVLLPLNVFAAVDQAPVDDETHASAWLHSAAWPKLFGSTWVAMGPLPSYTQLWDSVCCAVCRSDIAAISALYVTGV